MLNYTTLFFGLQNLHTAEWPLYRPFSHCIDQAGLGAFIAKSGRKHYNPPPLTVMWMNFDSPNFPRLCSLSAIISFQTCSNKCILYVLSFHKCIKIKYKMVNMYGVFLWLVQSSSRWNTMHSHLISVMRKWSIQTTKISAQFKNYYTLPMPHIWSSHFVSLCSLFPFLCLFLTKEICISD